MRGIESVADKHTRLARQFMDDARREIAVGDLAQGGEKLWGAASHAIRAYCASRGLPHARCAQRRQAVRDLADRLGNPSLREHFRIAESCHANFCNDWMEQENLVEDTLYVEELVNVVLGEKGESPAA